MSAVRENGATSGIGVLATYAYDDLGRRIVADPRQRRRRPPTATTRSRGSAALTQDLERHEPRPDLGVQPQPGGRRSSSNTARTTTTATLACANANVADTINGLNQVTADRRHAASAMTTRAATSPRSAAARALRLYRREPDVRATATARLSLYDPLRAADAESTRGTGRHRLDMLGDQQLITELDQLAASCGATCTAPAWTSLVWYEGSGTSDRSCLHADERGSIIAV